MIAREGILSIDKPGGMTSHDVVHRIRRLSGLRRVGHAGTLDPLATGVLLLCLGRATRLAEYLIGLQKGYEASLRLGQATDTYDSDGVVVAERPFAHVTPKRLSETLPHFCGSIQQKPPMYSALKKDGKPLYELARQGLDVERPLRTVSVYGLQLLGYEPPEVRLQINCSSGTYIRSLAHDLGESLGCGAHVTALRRTAVGEFVASAAVPLAELDAGNLPSYLQSMDLAVSHLPRVDLSEIDVAELLHGKMIQRHTVAPQAELARAYGPLGQFLGVIAANGPLWQPRKLFHPLVQGQVKQ
jgi:tRNA pseudouridine55 synthase